MKKTEDKTIKLKQGQKIAFVATVVTLLLAVMKAVVGYLFDSKVLVADALHSGADMVAIAASGFGLWLASRKKSRRFPYGLYKAETLITFVIGALILWAGVELLKDGWHKLFTVVSIQKFPWLPVIASTISIVTAYFIAIKEKSVGMIIGSQSLLANANESFLDILTSFVVLAGIILSYLKIPYVEAVVIMLISILIVKLGVENLWKSLMILMDANLEPRLQSEIKEKINEIYGVKGVGEVKIRQAGPFRMVECNIKTSPTLPLYRAHELADRIENFIAQNYKHVESVFIHVEPYEKKIVSAIIPVKNINGLDSIVGGHFGRAPYFVILKINNKNIQVEDFYYNEYLKEKKHIGVKVIKAVIRYKLDILFTSQIGEISFYMLKDSFVDIYKIEEGLSVHEVMKGYFNNIFEHIIKPTHSLEESQAV